MDFYFAFVVVACLLSLANASQFTTQASKLQNCGFNMSATCDDVMWLFADGDLLVGNSSDWRVTSEVHIPANTKVIEIHCLDSWIHGGILASSDNGLITDGAWNCSSDNRTTWNSAYLLGRNGRTAPDISSEAVWIWTDMSHWMQTDHRRHTKAICKIELETSQCPEPDTCPPFSEPIRTTTPIPTTKPTIRTTTPSKPKPGFNLTATCDNDMKLFVDGNLEATSSNWRDTSQVIIPANTESVEIHCMDTGIVGGILASSDNGLLTDGAWNCSSDNGTTWNPAYEVGPNGGAVPDISPQAEWIWTGCIGDWTSKYTGEKQKKNVICKIDLKPIIDGGWSAWSGFSLCSSTCEDATKIRTRTCSNPPPSNGGEPCHGLDEEVLSCGLSPCGGQSCRYTDKYRDCPNWKKHCQSGQWTACMNENCPKTCKCTTEKLWRDDGRCGKSYPLPNGKPGQCDPTANANEKGPCCSNVGWCGKSVHHCKCPSCVSYAAWTVIQRRGLFGNSEDYFYRDFSDYEIGFGSVDGEFWLGLKKIAALTSSGSWELQVDLTDWDGTQYQALYDRFFVGPSPTYQLDVSGFQDAKSTLGDSLAYHSGMNFTTRDMDQDNWSKNCASNHRKGGWWYKGCAMSNLNGLNFGHQENNSYTGIVWYHGKNRGNSHYRNFQASVIKMRKVNV